MTTKKVHFKINMEAICRQARTMLWEEGMDLDYCFEVVESMLMSPEINDEERRKIAIEILEGRKILIGINEGYLKEDGELIRPLTMLITKNQDKIKYYELMKHMDDFPYLYIDHHAGGYGIKHGIRGNKMTMNRFGEDDFEYFTTREMILWRKFGVTEIDSVPHGMIDEDPLERGTYLLQNRDLAYRILRTPVRDIDEASDKCTNYFNELLRTWKEEGKTYLDLSEYEQAVYNRNKMVDDEFPYAVVEDQIKKSVNAPTHEEFSSLLQEDKEKENEDKDLEAWRYIKNMNEGSISYKGVPDEQGKLESEYAWLSPQGMYYSCKFGNHTMKSYAIVMENVSLRHELYERKDELKERGKTEYLTEYDMATELLLEKGWAKFHDPSGNGRMRLSMRNGQKATPSQADAIRKVAIYFDLRYDPIQYSNVEVEEADTKGITGWLSHKGELYECEWGQHHVHAKEWTEQQNEHLDAYIKLGSHEADKNLSYMQMPILEDMTPEQKEWIEQNWMSLDKEQQTHYVEYTQSKLNGLSLTNEELKKKYEQTKEKFKVLQTAPHSLELHDWLALESSLLASLYGSDMNKINHLFTRWETIGHHLVSKTKKMSDEQ